MMRYLSVIEITPEYLYILECNYVYVRETTGNNVTELSKLPSYYGSGGIRPWYKP